MPTKRDILLMHLIDQIGRKIHLKTIPKRIVSLVPSQTELLYDLGLESSIVGITKFCVHPSHLVASKPIIGGTKQIHIEKIKALNPDIILCNKEENTPAIVEMCESICAVHVSDIETVDHNLELILEYGKLFAKELKAKSISTLLQEKIHDFKLFINDKPALKVAYFIWKDPWMVAGNTTFISHILKLNKLINVYGHLSRYPEVLLDELTEDIDVVFLSSEPFPFQQKHIDEINKNKPGLKIKLVNGEYFSWYGSRLLLAMNYFKQLRKDL